MNKKPTRVELLNMLLTAIDLPALVVEVTLDNVKYKPKQYKELRMLILQELKILSIEVSI
jgi:cAMP phosphodiesterase